MSPTRRTPTRMIRPMISFGKQQAFDALAKEYFEATVANVTSEHEAGDVLHAATLEVAAELEQTQEDQGRLQDYLDCSCEALPAATKELSDCWAAHEATGVKLCNAFRDVCNRRAAHEVICVETKKALHRTFEIKRKASEIQEGVATHRERTRRITNEHATSTMALALWVEPCKPQPKPRTP